MIPSIVLPTGEKVTLPGGYDPSELVLVGNCRFVGSDLLYAYDPTTGTGLAWCRCPAPYWQLIQPVTREGFEQWATDHTETLTISTLNNLIKATSELSGSLSRI